MKKSMYYIGLIVLLLIVNLTLLFIPKRSSSNGSSKTYFEEYDLSNLESISFQNKDQFVLITRGADRWVLNDSLKVDEGFFNTLLSILERVEATRQVTDWSEEVLGEMKLKFANASLNLSYASNAKRTKSYFIENGQVSEVSVPGYRDIVVDVFELHPDQWRDRLVFDGSWRTIQKIRVDRRDGKDVEIVFKDKFFVVNGQQPLDSSAVVDYLNQFQYFQANEMISKGRFPELDSLARTSPVATVTIDDINATDPLVLNIHSRQQDQNYHLVSTRDKLMVIDQQRVGELLALPSDFLSK